MTLGPRQPIRAPRGQGAQDQGWRVGLTGATSATGTLVTPAESPNERWQMGVAYRPDLVWSRPDPESEGARITGPGSFIDCPIGSESDQDSKAARGGDSLVEWDPYVIYDGDHCTVLDGNFDEAASRATASLNIQTSHLVENILWTGQVNGIDFTAEHPNTALASADAFQPNGTSPLGVVPAMSLMIETLAERLGSMQGMIHVPSYLIPYLDFYGQIVRDGNVIRTYAADHVVVAGTGYPGTDPAGAADPDAVWIYGTSMVELRLSPTRTLPASVEELYAAVDRDTDDLTVLAERMALAHFDRTAHIGIGVCVPDPGPDCVISGSS